MPFSVGLILVTFADIVVLAQMAYGFSSVQRRVDPDHTSPACVTIDDSSDDLVFTTLFENSTTPGK